MANLHIKVPIHRGAETFSFFSHALGVVAAIVGLVWLVIKADSTLMKAGFAIYGGTLIVLFSSSTAHHAVQTAAGHERSGIMRRLDHVAIYLFIAGTYTPVCLAIGGAWGISILSVVWGVGLIGILLKLFAPFTPRWLTVALYIAMGWIAGVAVKPMLETFAWQGLLWLLAGGIVYTLGAVGYAMKKPDLWPKVVGFHGVWHVMVLVAAACHFVFMVGYV